MLMMLLTAAVILESPVGGAGDPSVSAPAQYVVQEEEHAVRDEVKVEQP